MKRKFPIFSTALYVLSGLLAVYSGWAIIQCNKYLATMIAQGQLVAKGNLYGIVNFYMTNCSEYILFAVVLATLGWMLQKKSANAVAPAVVPQVETVAPEAVVDEVVSEEDNNEEVTSEEQNLDKFTE